MMKDFSTFLNKKVLVTFTEYLMTISENTNLIGILQGNHFFVSYFLFLEDVQIPQTGNSDFIHLI